MKGLVLKLPLLSVILVFSACSSSVWLVRSGESDGVVGYKNFSSQEDLISALNKTIPCPSWKITSDELRSSNYSYTTYLPVTTYSHGTVGNQFSYNSLNYSGTHTTQVPVQNVGTTYWREAAYQCLGAADKPMNSSNRAPSQVKAIPKLGSKESCKNMCTSLESGNFLKDGETIESCQKDCSSKKP